MAKILVTGASGFLGSWLVKEALARDLMVYAGVRASSSLKFLQDQRIHIFNMDFEDEETLKTQMREADFDYIIHNAGLTRSPSRDAYFRVNADYTRRLAEAALYEGNKLKKFFFMSSLDAYGSADNKPDGVVTHDSNPTPRTIYGESKLQAEKYLKAMDTLPYIIFRPTAVFGPGERDMFAIFESIKKYRLAPYFPTLEGKYSFIYAADLVRVALDATLSPHTRKAYFVTDGRIYQMRQFLDYIASAFDKKAFKFKMPGVALAGASQFNKLKDRLTGGFSLINDEQLAKLRAQNWDADISDLVNDFNYQAQYSLEKAVKETADWYTEHGWFDSPESGI